MVISPGSRNFPLIRAAVEHKVNMMSVVDERSAGFVGLGMAQALNAPVAVCCTSGTASLNYYPAIAEAFYANIPLLVLTADRPPESIDNWEGQSIRQTDVFQNHIVRSYQTPDDYDDQNAFALLAQSAIRVAMNEAGPVHVNLPFREPFYNTSSVRQTHTELGSPNSENSYADIPDELIEDITSAKRILWLNGAQVPQADQSVPQTIPVFSDVIANRPENISFWDGIMLSRPNLDESLLPEVLITTGKYMVSKQLRNWLRRRSDIKHWHVGNTQKIPTPFLTSPRVVNVSVESLTNLINREVRDSSYYERWQTLQDAYIVGLNDLNWTDFNEFSVIRKLNELLPEKCTIQLSNSMPVRYWGYLQKKSDRKTFCNRGTSGIDGCTSTAVGHALQSTEDVFLVTGDLAFFYDINGLWLESLPSNLKIIIMNNSGGGIFKMIDGPSTFDETIKYQTTPHNRTAKLICADLGITYHAASTWDEFDLAMNEFMNRNSVSVLEIITDSETNTQFYQRFKEIKT